MKNLPHQFNQVQTLRGVLQTAQDLGPRAVDDGAFGYELARRGLYRFRGLTGTLEDRIAAEQGKSKSSQGARTTARDMRRLLSDLGLFDLTSWVPTGLGSALLTSPPLSADERAVWGSAFTRLTVTDASGRSSHPGCILLRLLKEAGGLPKQALALALEPLDDSEAEFARAFALVGLPPAERRTKLGITEYADDNAVKILPALAQQAGLVAESAGTFVLTKAGETALESCNPAAVTGTTTQNAYPKAASNAGTSEGASSGEQGATGRASHRRRWQDRPPDLGPGEFDAGAFRTLTEEEQRRAAVLLKERNARHQQVVRNLARLCTREGVEVFEDPLSYDLLAVPEDLDESLILAEVKTLDDDAETQARRATGQLFWYLFRHVKVDWPGREVDLLAVFEGAVPEFVVLFLTFLGVAVGMVVEGRFVPLNEAADRLQPRLTG